jgi:hypothetical protein
MNLHGMGSPIHQCRPRKQSSFQDPFCYTTAWPVRELRDAVELITSEQYRSNKSLLMLAREQSFLKTGKRE